MVRRAVSLLAAAAFVLLAAGCGVEPAADPASDVAAGSPTPTVAQQPPAEAADGGDEENTEEEAEDRPVATDDCAAYANSGSWCTDGIGDYDCEGGTGNGPNYAPRNIDVIEPGVDPFGLDRNNDGEGCEGPAPAAPAPPPPADPGADPRFDTCAEAIDNGYGPYRQGQDPEYDWYRDSDSDGVVCE